jgi:hypothetical protein
MTHVIVITYIGHHDIEPTTCDAKIKSNIWERSQSCNRNITTVVCWDLKPTKFLKYFQTSLVIDHEMNHQNGDNSLWFIHIIIYLNKALF